MSEFKDFLLKQFRIDLIERDKKPTLSFYKLKYNYDYSDICYIVDNLGNKNNSYLNLLYGCSTPKTISELGDSKILYGESNEELEKEINWALLAIRRYSGEIQKYIDYKDKYESALILGDYETAIKQLDKIETEVCLSLWGIEQRFLILEIQKGLKENTKYLNEINENNKKWFIKYFSHFFSLKSEKELSVNQYNLTLARLLFKYYEDKKHVDLEYYNFKLNFLGDETLSYLPVFLTIEGYHSIIDRYITLIRIFQLEILKNNEENKTLLDSRLYYLSKKVNDKKIERLRLLIDTTFEYNYKLDKNDKRTIKLLDDFTSGNFDIAEKKLESLLIEQPLSIELYEIYVKSLIILNKPLKTFGYNKDSFQNRILNAIYLILSKNDDISDSLNELRKIAYNVSSFFSISFYLMNYYKEEVENKDVLKPLGIINSHFFNPTFLKLLNNNSHINQLKNEIGQSSTIDYLEFLDSNNLQLIQTSNLSAHRKSILSAKYYQNNELFEEAILEWESLLNNKNAKNFQKEKILQNLFYCKESIHQYDNCVDLYVDQYFINPLLVSNIAVDKLKKAIKKERYQSVKHTINLPLFYKLTNSDDYEIHTAYECYLIAQDCFTPTDFVANIHPIALNKTIFFLNSICTLDIFKHSPFITSSKQKLNERITVCNYLSKVDNGNKDEYIKEIEKLTKKLIIQKGIQEIDESKIYVNQTGIIDSELKNIQSIFNRYKMIGELKSEKDISILSLYSNKVLSFKYSEDDETNEFSKDPQFDIFKDIFYYLLDKFLFSNYGLQQYLSARIRHGVLLNEIRPEFEILHLITEKEKGIDKYKDNEFWKLFVHHLNESKNEEFQNILSDFSSKIDALINEEILSKYLQIKIEDKNIHGWLDYNFNDFLLQAHYIVQKETKETEVFINAIFDILWERTEQNLEDIRRNINGDIKEKFLLILLDLERGLVDLLKIIPEQLYNNITEARVNIENKLNKIANWFSITDSNISDFKIDKIIDVSLEYTQLSNINKSISPSISINSKSVFKGSFYPPLVDLFRIFLDNTLKHSGFDEGKISLFISIKEEKEELLIQLKNPLANSINIEELNKKICSFSLDMDKSMKEGRSGFHKAMRIIKSDLINVSNDMRLFITDDNEFCVDVKLKTEKLVV